MKSFNAVNSKLFYTLQTSSSSTCSCCCWLAYCFVCGTRKQPNTTKMVTKERSAKGDKSVETRSTTLSAKQQENFVCEETIFAKICRFFMKIAKFPSFLEKFQKIFKN